PIANRPNLTVLTNVEALRVLLENGRAAGLEVNWQGARRELRARREVILCAGAINTPVLLQRSGIGPRDLLEKHGV
ncbi:GMC family oxidoreductase N-terminal domain-containing protein, partial [Pseudomonas sp. BAgro211]|nr:GMC family oxidoreductase N-terminal domain-containing protein [Pseudomonas sp. BAgro211]